jgi:diguanylate cyclase (GGDEF)-like protein
MRLTTDQYQRAHPKATVVRPSRLAAAIALAAAFGLVFVIDWRTSIPGIQHLYYLPIVFTAIRFGMPAGTGAAVLAIALYHFANPQMLTLRYEESDIVQMAVFVASGLVAARLADDARRLHTLAMTDDLTGLHNLRSFELAFQRMVRLARREKTPLSVLVLDVDRLKRLNDQYGHLAGAEAVRAVGHLIAGHIPGDAVGCRYGGDEFVIALPRCPAAEARRVADNLRRAVIATAPVLAGLHFPARTLSISVGLSSLDGSLAGGEPNEIDDENAAAEALFRHADAALYSAKNGGRNRISMG